MKEFFAVIAMRRVVILQLSEQCLAARETTSNEGCRA